MPLEHNWAQHQKAFSEALSSDAIPEGWQGRGGIEVETLFAIYRNNRLSSLTNVLRTRFPVVEQMLGEEFFAALCCAFIEAHPPLSPVMAFYGADFPAFLEHFEPVQAYPYLPDLARLEDARVSSSYAKDAPALTGDDLAPLSPHALESCRFALHPATLWVASDYPILSLWQAHHEGDVSKSFSGEEAALITRCRGHVHVHRLDEASLQFVKDVEAGKTLGEASLAMPLDQLPALLALLLREGALLSPSPF